MTQEDLALLLELPAVDDHSEILHPRDHREAAVLLARISASKYEPAIPYLVSIACNPSPYARSKVEALDALRSIGGPAVSEAIVGRLLRAIETSLVPWDAAHPTLFASPMVQVALATDDRDPFERLAPFFEPERVASPTGAMIVRDVLITMIGHFPSTAHAVVALLHPDRAPAVRIGDDPRWIDRLVRLLGDRRLRPSAKGALDKLVRIRVLEAYERVAGPKVKKRAPPALDPVAVAAANEQAKVRAKGIRESLERTLATLKGAKYGPRAGAKTLPPLDVAANEVHLRELEKLLKAPVPAMVRALYLDVGPFDFQHPLNKEAPPELEAFANAPRFQVVPLDRAIKDVKRRIRENGGIPDSLRSPLALDLSDTAAVLLEPWCADPRMEESEATLAEYLESRTAGYRLR
jgi:hypothetical protein